MITGYFRKYTFFLFLIIIHELGHIIVSCFFSWKIKKIKLLPFGGLTIFEIPVNISLKEEFCVSISGVVFQIIGYFILSTIYDKTLFINIHYTLLIFNLLPIFPLDGSKIWNVFFNKIFPFKISHILSIIVSFLFLLYFILFIRSFIVLLIFLILLKAEIKEAKYHRLYFYKFLLERYLYSFHYRKIIYIDKIIKMKRDCYHYINFEAEKRTLKKYFMNSNVYH